MQAFTTHTGIAMPLWQDNIDTDQVIPARYLHQPRKAGYTDQLFRDLRFCSDDTPNPDFALNLPQYAGSTILITGQNFGCGSSREHAVWALMDYGFRAVIAPSFGDIFFNNSLKNGLLPVQLSDAQVEALAEEASKMAPVEITVDLKAQRVYTPTSGSFSFDINAYRKEALLLGASEIAMTLHRQEAIEAFEDSYFQRQPWIIPQQSIITRQS